jgi:hypothetical protein
MHLILFLTRVIFYIELLNCQATLGLSILSYITGPFTVLFVSFVYFCCRRNTFEPNGAGGGKRE